MRKVSLVLLTILLTVTLSACGSKKSESQNSVPMSGGKMDMVTADKAEKSEAKVAEEPKESKVVDQSRKIIYTANSTISVKDLKASYDSIIAKAQEIGGYVANSTIRESYSQITVRIPAVKLEDYLKYLDTLGGENKETTVSTNDVTEEYTDIQSRLRNLKAHEEQLLSIMKKATTVEDTLKIHNELFRVRGEIEAFEGKIKMWDKLVELSTVTIRLNRIPEMGGSKDVKISFISFDEILKGMSNGFKTTFNFTIRFITGIFVLLISMLPIVPFIALIVWLIIRFRKKIKKNKSQ